MDKLFATSRRATRRAVPSLRVLLSTAVLSTRLFGFVQAERLVASSLAVLLLLLLFWNRAIIEKCRPSLTRRLIQLSGDGAEQKEQAWLAKWTSHCFAFPLNAQLQQEEEK